MKQTRLLPFTAVAMLALAWSAYAVDPASSAAKETSSFAPTVANSSKPSSPAPEGMVWIPGGEFSMGSVLGAVPDTKSAMLYSLSSLSAITSYGHANLFLEEQWQLMGALEALNGMLLFGLTTAFLFAMIQKVWPLGSRGWHRKA